MMETENYTVNKANVTITITDENGNTLRQTFRDYICIIKQFNLDAHPDYANFIIELKGVKYNFNQELIQNE